MYDLQIVMPMAGQGSQFYGIYKEPKPLIPINGIPMICKVLNSLGIEGHYHFIIRKYEDYQYNKQLRELLKERLPDCYITEIDYLTEGAACSAMIGVNNLNEAKPVIIADCDMILKWNPGEFLDWIKTETPAGATLVNKNCNDRACSYASFNNDGSIRYTAEKELISSNRLIGIHYWQRAKLFKKAINYSIQNNLRTRNEFYISTTWNYLVNRGYRVLPYFLNKNEFFSVGTPTDLKDSLQRTNGNL